VGDRVASAVGHDGPEKSLLLAGGSIAGRFWPADGGQAVHAVLRFTPEDGCEVELIERSSWSFALGGPWFTLHGETTDGLELTVLDAWVNQIDSVDRVSRVRGSTLAIGELTEPEERWARAIYSTANLTEWHPENGLTHSGHTEERPRLERVDFDPPATEEVALPDARLRIELGVDTRVAWAPDWGISTWRDLAVIPQEPFTVAEARRLYGVPLLALTHLAADRPDSIDREILRDPDSRRRIDVLREGVRISPRPWRGRGSNGYLFQRDELPDLSAATRRWWELSEETRPALGLFADHVAQGNVYSPGRLLTLYTALEKYSKTRFGTKKEFKPLRDYGEIPAEITGCTTRALKLLGATRGFFAHAGTQGDGFSPEEIEAEAMGSIRRASALLQGCLLRELGFGTEQRIALMEAHYRDWPIPRLGGAPPDEEA
jgi:hypothetical protein